MTDKWSCFAGDLLKRSRAQAGLSQRQLAALAGVSNVEVARIESHRVQPSIPTLGRLLDVCGSGVELSGRYVDNRVDAITA
ncbi:helix-turn-helix transcriptional regulator, partial [Ferrimicrobium sp.]